MQHTDTTQGCHTDARHRSCHASTHRTACRADLTVKNCRLCGLQEHKVKDDLLAVMEKVKQASVFFAETTLTCSEPTSFIGTKAGNTVRKKIWNGDNCEPGLSRQSKDELLNRRLQEYRERPDDYLKFTNQVRQMQGSSFQGTTNKLQRNIRMMVDLTPAGKARKAEQKRQRDLQKQQALETFKAKEMSEYNAKCKETRLRHANDQSRADKAIADRFSDKTTICVDRKRRQCKTELVSQSANHYSVFSSPEVW